MAGSDLVVKLRILFDDNGVAQKIGKMTTSVADLGQEFDRLAGKSSQKTNITDARRGMLAGRPSWRRARRTPRDPVKKRDALQGDKAGKMIR